MRGQSMKRTLILSLLFFILVFPSFAQINPKAAEALEPGDQVRFNFSSWEDSARVFRVEADTYGQILEFFTTGNADPYLTLYTSSDYSYPLITADDEDGFNSMLQYVTDSAGVYYLELGFYDLGSGTLEFNIKEISTDWAENNDTRRTATNLSLSPELSSATIFPEDDVDNYSFVIGQEFVGKYIVFQTYGDLDLVMTLYDANGNYLDENDDFEGVNPRIAYFVEEPITLVIEIGTYFGDESGLYQLFAGIEYSNLDYGY
jgi:hypothetical protein